MRDNYELTSFKVYRDTFMATDFGFSIAVYQFQAQFQCHFANRAHVKMKSNLRRGILWKCLNINFNL